MSKYYKITFLFTGLLILFYSPIKKLYDEKITDTILSKIEPNLVIDSIFILILFFVLRKIYLNFINKTYISGHQWLFSLISISFFIYIRFYQNYNFFGFTFFDPLKYLDVLSFYLLISPLTSILSIFHKKKKSIENTNHLFDDSPINAENEDALTGIIKLNVLQMKSFNQKPMKLLDLGLLENGEVGKLRF